MEFVIKAIRAGKTTQLIKMAAEANAYIIVKDAQRIKHIQTIARKLKVKIPYPITISEALRGKYHAAGIKAFMIDDVEEILHYIVPGVPILAVTGTKVPSPIQETEEFKKTSTGQ